MSRQPNWSIKPRLNYSLVSGSSGLPPDLSPSSLDFCPWMDVAMQEIGTREFKNGSNPKVVEYLQSCDARFASSGALENDESDWCSAFVSWCLQQSDIAGTKHPRARSWIRWGMG